MKWKYFILVIFTSCFLYFGAVVDTLDALLGLGPAVVGVWVWKKGRGYQDSDENIKKLLQNIYA